MYATQDKELQAPKHVKSGVQYTQKHVLAKEKFLKFEQFLK
jgi:hypothetical protein